VSVTHYTKVDSPIGQLLLVGDDAGLSGLYMQDGERPARIGGDWFPAAAPFESVTAQLDEYFAGQRAVFGLRLALRGSSFQRLVWQTLLRIPHGQTATYGEIARRVGRPADARAVGWANASNPVAVIVPCHRVVGADGTLTGYAGGLERKRLLLDLESGDRAARLFD
jgi:methylated-DNA-[protein]-cysteine S-methyltransferase